jgi:hypothetical protein
MFFRFPRLAGVLRASPAAFFLLVVVAFQSPPTIVATAIPAGGEDRPVAPGDAVTVPVTLDLSRVGSDGDLGAAEFVLSYDANVFRFDSATTGVKGMAHVNGSEPGRVRFAFVATVPQGSPRLTLAAVNFTVRRGARPGRTALFRLDLPSRPVRTTLLPYDAPRTVGGGVTIANSSGRSSTPVRGP